MDIKDLLVSSKSKWKEYLLLGLYFVCTTICELLLLLNLCLHSTHGWSIQLLIGTAFFFIPSLLLFIKLYKKHTSNIPYLFVLIGLPIVVAFSFFLIPTNVPDEPAHIIRVIDNRSGTSPLYIPEAMSFIDEHWVFSYPELWTSLNTQFDYSSWVATTKTNAGGYTEFNYLIPALIFDLGVVFNINGWISICAARFVNALLYLIASYWMIKRLPTGKVFLFVFLLNPILLQQASSCSADALCNIGALCFIVQLIYMKVLPSESFNIKEWLVLFAFAGVMGLCKYVYLVLMLGCFILLPKIKRSYIKKALPVLAFALLISALLLVVSKGYDISRLTAWLEDPAALLLAINDTLVHEASILIWQFFGGNLGWPSLNGEEGEIEVPYAWLLLMSIMALSFGRYTNPHPLLLLSREKWRIFVIITALAGSFAIFLTLMSSSNPADGVRDISWLQGRYFIPPMLLLALAFLDYQNLIRPHATNAVGGFSLMKDNLGISSYIICIIVIHLISIYYIVRFFFR